MGEKSKSIGEYGENIVEKIIKEFGWRGTTNLSVNCVQRAKHNKITHGIDFLGSHENPLISDSQEVLYLEF